MGTKRSWFASTHLETASKRFTPTPFQNPKENKMILITTPNGRVGSEVVKQLQAKGQRVRVGAHSLEKAQAVFPEAEVIHFDYGDEASIRAALQGIDRLFLASPGHVPTQAVNRTVDVAKELGVQHIVKLSSMSVTHMDGSLRQNEQHIQASGLAWAFLRPNWFMQNYSTAAADGVRQGRIAEAAEGAATSFVDVRDIAAVAVAALTQDGHAGRIYTITGPSALTREQVAEQLSAALGREVRYVPISDEQLQQGMRSAGIPETAVHQTSALFGNVRAGQTAAVTDDVQRVTGRPPIRFQQFANEHADIWR
jgi:uncharacterized protein YbjT (DUF2867 family)